MNADARTIKLVADRLCLNFVNTVDSFAKTEPKEYLRSYADLVGWSEHAGWLRLSEAGGLLAESERRPIDALAALERARELRFALYQLFAAVAHKQPIPPRALDRVNKTVAEAPPRTQLVVADQGFAWARHANSGALELPMWGVAWSAADLLTSPEVVYLRECDGDGCTWTFLDTSRGRTRRWCSMDWCGNRAKARRHYQRQRA